MLWLETGFDVCRQGCVSFSHPTNQNHAGGEEQPETLQIQAEGRPGRAPGLSSLVGVCVLLCLPHLRQARVADSSEQGEPGYKPQQTFVVLFFNLLRGGRKRNR